MTIHVTNVPATLHDYPSGMHQEGGAGGAAVPPDFGRSEGAAGQLIQTIVIFNFSNRY